MQLDMTMANNLTLFKSALANALVGARGVAGIKVEAIEQIITRNDQIQQGTVLRIFLQNGQQQVKTHLLIMILLKPSMKSIIITEFFVQ